MQVCLSPFYIPSGGMNFENTIAHFALGRDPRLKFPANLSSPLVFTALKHFQHLVDISSQPTLRRTNASKRRLSRAFIALFSNFQLFIFRTRSSLFFFLPVLREIILHFGCDSSSEREGRRGHGLTQLHDNIGPASCKIYRRICVHELRLLQHARGAPSFNGNNTRRPYAACN